MGKECPFHGEGSEKGQCPLSIKFIILGSRNVYFGALSSPSKCLLVHCNTSRSRPPVRLRSLIFQADSGSIKGAGVPAEEDVEHYLSW